MKSVLTKSQTSELLRAASLLPLASRDAFITQVDKRLRVAKRPLTDAAVSAAIASTLATLNVTTSHFMCDQQETTMAKKYEVYDRYGNRVEDDDDVLRDGQRLVVPLNMRDSRQREAAEHFERFLAEDARSFGLNDALALHKPGQRFVVDAAARAHVEQVYQDEKRKLQQAWRTPNGRGERPGDVCTVNGAAGHLDHRLQCVPDKRQDAVPRGPVYDAVEGQRVKDEAYRAMVNELTTAWQRKPVGVRR